jgi:hypothetical protein
MDPKKEDPGYYNISEILDCQDENTVEIDYLCDGAERIIDLSNTPTYSNITLTSGGYNTTSNPYVYTTGTGASNPWATNTTLTGGKLHLEGEGADIDINGKSLLDTLQSLEERLNILVPNPGLEAEWSELRRLGDQYRKLEADLKEKSKMWSALQKT